MVALQIRDVPDDVRDRLAELAKIRGQSMQALLLALVTEEARRSANVALLERFSARDDGSRLSYAESAEMVDKTRSERQAHLTGRDPSEDHTA
jgi:hypothetical protein